MIRPLLPSGAGNSKIDPSLLVLLMLPRSLWNSQKRSGRPSAPPLAPPPCESPQHQGPERLGISHGRGSRRASNSFPSPLHQVNAWEECRQQFAEPNLTLKERNRVDPLGEFKFKDY